MAGRKLRRQAIGIRAAVGRELALAPGRRISHHDPLVRYARITTTGRRGFLFWPNAARAPLDTGSKQAAPCAAWRSTSELAQAVIPVNPMGRVHPLGPFAEIDRPNV